MAPIMKTFATASADRTAIGISAGNRKNTTNGKLILRIRPLFSHTKSFAGSQSPSLALCKMYTIVEVMRCKRRKESLAYIYLVDVSDFFSQVITIQLPCL